MGRVSLSSSDKPNCFLHVQLAKSVRDVSKFASIGLIDADAPEIQAYIKYFDITLIPATIFFFNAHHMKMDSGYALSVLYAPCQAHTYGVVSGAYSFSKMST